MASASPSQRVSILSDGFNNLLLSFITVRPGYSQATSFRNFKVIIKDSLAKRCGGLADIFIGEVADPPSDCDVPTLLSVQGRVSVKSIRTNPKGTNSRMNIILALESVEDLWPMMRHTNIAPIFPLMSDENAIPAVAVPWFEKGNVLDYLRRFPGTDRLPMVKQLASAIEYLHSVELLHGNIVPFNILIADDNSVRLADVGLHACITKATYAGAWFLPSEWMYKAPEELSFECDPSKFMHTKAMDVYAFASSVYTMYALKAPFSAGSYSKSIPKILFQGHGVLERSVDIPLSCWDLLQRCWSFDPDARPSATAIISSLTHI